MPSDNPQAAPLAPVARAARLADMVADQIAEQILSGALSPGEALAPERELCREFDVSRTVIREAIRSLAGKGMVESIGGSGVRVLAIDAGTVGESLRNLVRSSDVDYAKVDEVRRALEVAAAGVAAARVTADDVARAEAELRRMRDRIEDVEECVQADLAFHRAIADTTGNELFSMLLDSLGAPLAEVRRTNLGRGGVARRRRIIAAHRRILDAVAEGDAGGARAAMEDHLDEVRRAADQ
ncbi:MAG TPA: FCD domain-containing protein [Solirubrobacteraceae bacterium]|nr:FCD domain-containing protein [Solirubrobacteraceae bacterium]